MKARPASPRALFRWIGAFFLVVAAAQVSTPASSHAASVDGVWSNVPAIEAPSGRKWDGLIYDPLRQRMLLFGGFPGPQGDVWALSLTGPPAWTRLVTVGQGPSARFAHRVIYQPGLDRMIVFGGNDGAFRNDVWALSLSGTPTWAQLTPAGIPPAPRWANVAVYDAVRDRMIIFGGYDGSVSRNDTWALSLGGAPTWTELAPSGPLPEPRTNVDGVYDSARDQIVVFGGFDTGTQQFLNDVWTLSLAGAPAWSPVLPAGTPPAPRRDHSMVFDASRAQVVVFGGIDPLPRNDAFVLGLGSSPAWTPLAPAQKPTKRSGHGAVYDAPRDRMLVFGGDDGGYLADLWSLALGAPTTWNELTAPAGLPGPRRNFAMTNVGGAGFFFGGENGPLRDDAGLLTLGATPAWQPLFPSAGPSARFGHHAIYDAPEKRVVVFGGSDGSFLNDVWSFSLRSGSWEELDPTGTPPSPRMYYGLAVDGPRGRMFVIGGHPGPLNDVWELRLRGTPAWTPLTTSGTPPSPRFAHSAIYQPRGNRVIVFGGYDGAYRNDVWELSLGSVPAWKQLTPAGTPPAGRWASATAYDPVRERMLLFGGFDGAGTRDDVWALSLGANPTWTQLAPTGPQPPRRANAEGMFDSDLDQFVVMGGFDTFTQQFFGDGWILSFGDPKPPRGRGAIGASIQRPDRLSLTGPHPNPARLGFAIRFSLEDSSPASLEMFDMAGRRVFAREVGSLGPGPQELRPEGSAPWPAGVYFARLIQHGRVLESRIAVVR